MSRKPFSRSRFRVPRRIRRRSQITKSVVKILALILLLVVAILGGHYLWQGFLHERLFPPPQEAKDYHPLSDLVDVALKEALDELGASPLFITQNVTEKEEEGTRWRFRQLSIRVTAQISLFRCNLAITKATQRAGGQVLSVVQSRQGNGLTMKLGVEGLPTHLLELISDQDIQPTLGRLAIIIDDFGAINNEVAHSMLRLPIALTAAVIPGHPSSQQISRQAKGAGHEVFVHLPMQPKKGELGEENGIFVDLPEDEIRRRVRWALAELPEAVGVNNHMGSLATENERVMAVVLQEIKAAGKIFVDSRTSSQSVALDVALRLNMSCAESDAYLDDQDDSAVIKKRLTMLAERALREGSAIGIGHIRVNTLQALEDIIPRLERTGVRFVHVSRVLR